MNADLPIGKPNISLCKENSDKINDMHIFYDYPNMYDTEIEYLENTSNSYINTGLKGKASLKIEADWMFIKSEVAGIMGASYNHVPNYALLYRANSGTSSYFYVSSYYGISALTLNKKWNIIMDKGKLYYDNILKKSATISGDSTYNFMLFKAADFGTCVKGQLFKCKIWEADTLVRDYIPVKKNNIGYLFDKVSGQLYGNAGSGSFVCGPDLNISN